MNVNRTGAGTRAISTCAVLARYRATPTVLGHVRRSDPTLAENLYERGGADGS